jgi:hypothetical protein
MDEYDKVFELQQKVAKANLENITQMGNSALDAVDRAIMQQAALAEIQNPQSDQATI